jgi:hypothetical protein
MSSKLMEKVLALDVPLSHAAFRVLMVLAKYANDDGTNCFPSMQTIEDTGQMTRGSVVRCLEQLVQAGVVVSEHRKGRKGNTYLLQIPETVAPSDHSPPSKGSHDRTVPPRPNGPIVGLKQPLNGPIVAGNSPIIGPDSIRTLSKKERTPLTGGSAPDPKGHRLPADWKPGDDLAEFAARLGLNGREVAARFRDYWHAQPGAKGRKLDWAATWRNWCREDERRAKRPTVAPRKSRMDRWRDLVGEEDGPTIDGQAETFRPYLIAATGD